MPIVEAIGLAAKELFDYNRENFQFDNEQRIERDVQKMQMQIRRFELFREDLEDLVKLTVDKMDMYHLVGALFLGFNTMMFTEGRINGKGVTPNFFVCIYFLSTAGAWIYLLMAVWLSMYASISSHSFGVRLRTRYVRLPIPNMEQIMGITARLADFEKLKVNEVMRLPFGPNRTPHWNPQASQMPGGPAPPSASPGAAASAGPRNAYQEMTDIGAGALPTGKGPKAPWHEHGLLGPGEAGLASEEVMLEAASTVPGRHVQLFRKLQAKWQCYDAYARVSMALGVNQILQALNYFVIGLTLVENNWPTIAWALSVVFQSAAMSISILDIAGLRTWQLLIMQAVGAAPVMLVLIALTICLRAPDGSPDPSAGFSTAPAAFICEALWFQLLLLVARPSADEATLPRRFRTVLFLDVFGDAAYDPTEAEHATPPPATGNLSTSATGREMQETRAGAAELAISRAQAALRRWEAIPAEHLTPTQQEHLQRTRREYSIWRKALQGHLVQQKNKRGAPYIAALRDAEELRTWAEISPLERQEDEYAESLLGPLESKTTRKVCFFELESASIVHQPPSTQRILTLRDVGMLVQSCKELVQLVLAGEDGSSSAAVQTISYDQRPSQGEHSASQSSQGGHHHSPSKAHLIQGERSQGVPGAAAKDHYYDPMERKQNVAESLGHSMSVERLPWWTVRRLTQVIQMCWLFMGGAWAVQDGFPATFRQGLFQGLRDPSLDPPPAGNETGPPAGGRRLSSELDWYLEFEQVDIAWPHGIFYRPEGLSLAEGSNPDHVLLRSPYHHHKVNLSSSGTLRPSQLPRSRFTPGAVPLCGREDCLLAAIEDAGLTIWAPGDARKIVLATERPWKLLAGAYVPCQEAGHLSLVGSTAGSCLLLAGWDGDRAPVALVPLGPDGLPAAGDLEVRMELPLQVARKGTSVRALSFEPSAGRLWFVTGGRELEAWSLFSSTRLGVWQMRTSGVEGDLLLLSVCEVPGPAGRLLVAALRPDGEGAVLLASPFEGAWSLTGV